MLVSVCIACYNAEISIRSTLKSIQNQTHEDFEVIIVDDNSTDNTVRIIYDEFCTRDKRFKLFVNNTNEKYFQAHNLSYQYAKGKYLFRIDADDILYEDYLQYHIDFLEEHPEYDAFSTRMARVKFNNGISRIIAPEEDAAFLASHSKEELDWFNENNVHSMCGNTIIWSNPSSSLRKSFYDEHQPRFYSYVMGDYIFWWNVLAEGGRLYKSDVEKSVHCSYGNNISNDSNFYNGPASLGVILAGFQEKAFLLQGDIPHAEQYRTVKEEFMKQAANE